MPLEAAGALPKPRDQAQVRTLTPGNCGSIPTLTPHRYQSLTPHRAEPPASPAGSSSDLEPYGRPYRAAPAAYNMAPPTSRPPVGAAILLVHMTQGQQRPPVIGPFTAGPAWRPPIGHGPAGGPRRWLPGRRMAAATPRWRRG